MKKSNQKVWIIKPEGGFWTIRLKDVPNFAKPENLPKGTTITTRPPISGWSKKSIWNEGVYA